MLTVEEKPFKVHQYYKAKLKMASTYDITFLVLINGTKTIQLVEIQKTPKLKTEIGFAVQDEAIYVDLESAEAHEIEGALIEHMKTQMPG